MPFNQRGPRYGKEPHIIHRRAELLLAGGAGTSVATAQIDTGPGAIRAIAVDYVTAAPATTDLLIKDGDTNGRTVFTKSNSGTDLAASLVGTGGVDEANGALLATDTHGGGLLIAEGVFIDLAQGNNADVIRIDVWFEPLGFTRRILNPVGGAGTSVVTDTVRLARAGLFLAVALDFTTQAVTTDTLIKADDTTGATLFTYANSTTDLAPTYIGTSGIDEGGAATAVTDMVGPGQPFKQGLFIDVAQADDSSNGAKSIVVDLWYQ
jgi:hypothetical protein